MFASAVGLPELPTSTSNSRVFRRWNIGINQRDMRLSAAGEAGRLGETIPGGLMLGYSVLVRVWNQFCYALKYFVGYLDDIFYGIFREIFPSTEGAKYFIKYFANPFAVKAILL